MNKFSTTKMFRTAVMVVAAIMAESTAFAEDNISHFDPNQTPFDSPQEAAVEALHNILSLDQKIEHSGVVFEFRGNFYYTLPATSGRGNKTRVQIAYPQGAKIVALYHNHPRPIGNDRDLTMLFSALDVSTADDLHADSYIYVQSTGEIREYSPGTDKHETKTILYHVTNGDVADGHFVQTLASK
jgi:hypothetical protein